MKNVNNQYFRQSVMPQVPILLKSHSQRLRRLRLVSSVCSYASLCVYMYIYSSGDNFYTENKIFNCRTKFLIAFKLQMGKYRNRLIFVQHLNRVLKTTSLHLTLLQCIFISYESFCKLGCNQLLFFSVVPILFVGPWGISRSKLENTGQVTKGKVSQNTGFQLLIFFWKPLTVIDIGIKN